MRLGNLRRISWVPFFVFRRVVTQTIVLCNYRQTKGQQNKHRIPQHQRLLHRRQHQRRPQRLSTGNMERATQGQCSIRSQERTA
nr:MAG TPA: hypothetical protein [Caudoviricetes sp.]